MWLAVDMETGVEISVIKANRYDEYLCPCCGDKVEVVKGLRRNYFKHRYGTKRVDCDNYWAGTKNNSFGGWREEIETRQRLALYGSSYVSKGKRSWFLELYLPQYDGPQDLVVVDGYSGIIRIPNNSIPRGGTKVKVIPKKSQYLIKLVRDGCDDSVPIQLPGLTTTQINVFAYGDSSGRLLDESTPLINGQTYLMVYHRSMLNATKMLEDYLDLGDLNDWHAIICRIPMNISPAMHRWINSYLSREVCLPSLSLKLLSPAKCLTLENGSIIVPDGAAVIIAIDGAKGAKAPGLLGIKSSVNAKPEWISLKGTLPQVISLGNLRIGTYDLLVPGESKAFLQIIIQPFPIIEEHFNIKMVFRQLDTAQEKLVAPVFSDQIKGIFEKVKLSEVEIVSFFIAEGIPFQLLIKRQGGEWTEQAKRPGNMTSTRLDSNSEIVDRLHEALRSNWHILFKAGNFGSFEILPRSKKGLSQRLTLPHTLKSKIEWIFLSNIGNNRTRLQAYYVGYVERMLTNQLVNLFEYKDQELLKKLRRIKSIRIELLQSYLDIILQVSRFGGRGVRK